MHDDDDDQPVYGWKGDFVWVFVSRISNTFSRGAFGLVNGQANLHENEKSGAAWMTFTLARWNRYNKYFGFN